MKKKNALFFTIVATMFLVLQADKVYAVEGVSEPVISESKVSEEDYVLSGAKESQISFEQYKLIMAIPNFDSSEVIEEPFSSRSVSQQDSVVKKALSYIGVPYVWGGTTPNGFDCSGLVQYVYKNAPGVGINLPRITTDQERIGSEVNLNSLQKGDILFWGSRGNSYHDAIYIGNGQYVHAPEPGQKVKVGEIKYWAPNFARRVLSNTATEPSIPPTPTVPDKNSTITIPSTTGVNYESHISKVGWMGWVSNNVLSGSTGFALKMEALKMKLINPDFSGSIEYTTRVEGFGWQNWVKDGEITGTVGQSKRAEALKVRLTGDMAREYDIVYQTHVQGIGWQSPVKNGEEAGTINKNLRIEAVRVSLERKKPENDVVEFTKGINYESQVQTFGWLGNVANGSMSGTMKRALRLEAFKVRLHDQEVSGSIEYATRVQDYGWQNWVKDGAVSGTVGQAKRAEMIRLRLTGEMSSKYNVVYRTHVESIGWMPWCSNGEEAGTVNKNLRIEAVEIKLVAK